VKRAVRILPVVTLGVVAVAALTGFALIWTYRPATVWGDSTLVDDAVRGLVSVHELSLQAAVTLALVTVVMLGVARQSVGRVVAMGVVLLSAVVASMTWGLITWDQIALDAVAVGTAVRGLWFPAFDDGVAFVLIDGAEIGQETYRRSLLVHLAALAVSLVASVVGVWPVRRAPELDDLDPDDIPVFDLT
jgi:quinol-cytochrome oxidoreductase complex cytochrome b subunit